MSLEKINCENNKNIKSILNSGLNGHSNNRTMPVRLQ